MFEVQSFVLDTAPQSFCQSFIVLSMTRCLKSAQKFAVRVCQVTTVSMATTQLVLSQIKKLFATSVENWIRSLSTKDNCCELVKLCHINCSGPVLLDTVYRYINHLNRTLMNSDRSRHFVTIGLFCSISVQNYNIIMSVVDWTLA